MTKLFWAWGSVLCVWWLYGPHKAVLIAFGPFPLKTILQVPAGILQDLPFTPLLGVLSPSSLSCSPALHSFWKLWCQNLVHHSKLLQALVKALSCILFLVKWKKMVKWIFQIKMIHQMSFYILKLVMSTVYCTFGTLVNGGSTPLSGVR